MLVGKQPSYDNIEGETTLNCTVCLYFIAALSLFMINSTIIQHGFSLLKINNHRLDVLYLILKIDVKLTYFGA